MDDEKLGQHMNVQVFLQGHSSTEKRDTMETEKGQKFKAQPHLGHCEKRRSWRKIQ